MNNIDDYNNLIKVLGEILTFYSYKGEYDLENSLIRQDKGHQAKFGLEKIEEFNKREEDLLDNLKDLINKDIGDFTNLKEFGETMEILKTLENLENLNKLNSDSI